MGVDPLHTFFKIEHRVSQPIHNRLALSRHALPGAPR